MAVTWSVYRFEAGCDDEYEAMRSAGDVSLGLVSPDTCIEPAATAIRDSRGRILLRIESSSPVFSAIAATLLALQAVGTVVANPPLDLVVASAASLTAAQTAAINLSLCRALR